MPKCGLRLEPSSEPLPALDLLRHDPTSRTWVRTPERSITNPVALMRGLECRLCIGQCIMREPNIGKWYDPISEHWILPYEAHSASADSKAEETPEELRRLKAERIWSLLVKSCARD